MVVFLCMFPNMANSYSVPASFALHVARPLEEDIQNLVVMKNYVLPKLLFIYGADELF